MKTKDIIKKLSCRNKICKNVFYNWTKKEIIKYMRMRFKCSYYIANKVNDLLK